MKNIGYHTRLYSDNSVKICDGSFGGSLDMDTVNRLVKSHFSVVVKPSGAAIFVDREGREVCLYIAVDAGATTEGIKALCAWRAERAKQLALDEELQESREQEIEDLMNGPSHEEIVRRLKVELK